VVASFLGVPSPLHFSNNIIEEEEDEGGRGGSCYRDNCPESAVSGDSLSLTAFVLVENLVVIMDGRFVV
jgi:hypothetical protein